MKIDIRDGISDEVAIELVGIVIRQGRISKKGDKMYYCWTTYIEYDDEKYMVYVRDNRKTERTGLRFGLPYKQMQGRF